MDEKIIAQSEEYGQLAASVIEEHEELHFIPELGIRVAYLVSTEPKTKNGKYVLGQCEKIPEKYKWCMPYDFQITIYEANTALYSFDEEQRRILMWHELSHIGVDGTPDNLKLRIVPHDIEDFEKIIAAHGLRWSMTNTGGESSGTA